MEVSQNGGVLPVLVQFMKNPNLKWMISGYCTPMGAPPDTPRPIMGAQPLGAPHHQARLGMLRQLDRLTAWQMWEMWCFGTFFG